MSKPQLCVRSYGVTEIVGLESKELTIGTAANNALVLKDPSISLYHARLVRIQHGFYLEDLGSTYGTWVNGNLIGEHRLEHGDTINLGVYTLVFSLQQDSVLT
jgi:pSer/pThr/pTyr-binding forkhead associated (FHA) protein